MKSLHIVRIAALATAVAALTAVPALAQGGRMGMMGGMPRYDKATERTITGTVDQVQRQEGRGRGAGLHLAFKTDAGVLDVHVGPTWWLDEQKYEFAAGDTLTITGSAVKVAGQDAFIAREIVKGTETYTLRNAEGFPSWAGRGARPRTR